MDATEHEPPIVKNSPKIPGYTILSRLGEGGMATVYLAIQESFGRKVALKVMMHKAQEDPSYGERFLREARIVARLSHPHIVPVYDVGSSGDCHYISMEYLDAGNLADRIQKGLTLNEVICITRDVAAALDYAHRKGFIHRDIKPDNIMFREDGAAVLTDFGIARPTSPDSNMTQVGKVIGTPKYMSPEQTKGDTLDNTCDLYALGIMLYEMLTSNVPFDGGNAFEIGIKHLKEPVPRLPKDVAVFQTLIDKLLVKNKEQRLQSGQEVISILGKIEEVLRLKKALEKSAERKKGASKTKTPTPTPTPNITQSIRADASDRQRIAITEKKQRISVSLVLLLLIFVSLSAFAVIWAAPKIAPDNKMLMTAHKQLIQAILPDLEPKTPKIVASSPAPIEPMKPNTPEITPIQKELNEAKVAAALGNYATPEGESALDHYLKALEIEPENLSAKLGIADIASKLVDQTNEAIEAGNFDRAHELIFKTKSISENIPGLAGVEALLETKEQEAKTAEKAATLAKQKAAEAKKAALLAKQKAEREKKQREAEEEARQKAEAARIAAEEEQKARTTALMNKVRINGLLAKGNTYFTRGDFYGASPENALKKYQEVLNLDPENTQAQEGVEKVVNVMLKDIHDKLAAQEPGSAQRIYNLAIEAAPNNTALQALGRSRNW